MIWIILALLDFLVSLAAFPLVPLIVLFDSPWWSWPWMTHDNTIDGDGGHMERWQGKPVWMRRIAWLWRNRGYNFSYYITGSDAIKPVRIVAGRAFWKDANPRGYCIAHSGSIWMIFAWLPYSRNRGLRVYLGWKLRGAIDSGKPQRAMLVTHINPFKGKI